MTRKIEDRTVKEIFENLMGRENASSVLVKIQEEYEKGVRGDDLKSFAERAIGDVAKVTPGPSIGVGVHITVEAIFDVEPLR